MSHVTFIFSGDNYINNEKVSLPEFLNYWMGYGEDIFIPFDPEEKEYFTICWDPDDGYTYSFWTEKFKQQPTKLEIGNKCWMDFVNEICAKVQAIHTLIK